MIRAQRKAVPVDQLATVIDHAGSAVELLQSKLEDILFGSEQPDLGIAGTVSDEEIVAAVADVEPWLDRGLDIRSVLDSSYPQSLHAIFDRPPLVLVRGSWREIRDRRSIAVVGTRKASEEGLARASRITRELVKNEFTILSGLAAGIDFAAHSAALDAGGRTVAVMGFDWLRWDSAPILAPLRAHPRSPGSQGLAGVLPDPAHLALSRRAYT